MAGFIKDYLFYKKIKKAFLLREPMREKKLRSLSEVRSCLVLFDASDERECQIMFSIIKELQDSGKHIRSVGYVQWKHNPHWCFPKISYDYLNTKHIAFTGLPKADFVNDLMAMHFDMLIDFLNRPVPAMCYISALANASVKIARNRSQAEFFEQVFDFIIEQPELSDRDFFEQVKKYLHMLKNDPQ